MPSGLWVLFAFAATQTLAGVAGALAFRVWSRRDGRRGQAS